MSIVLFGNANCLLFIQEVYAHYASQVELWQGPLKNVMLKMPIIILTTKI